MGSPGPDPESNWEDLKVRIELSILAESIEEEQSNEIKGGCGQEVSTLFPNVLSGKADEGAGKKKDRMTERESRRS